MSTTDQSLNTAISDPQGERERSRRLAERYRCPFVDLFEQRIDPELFRSIPAELMFRFNFVPMEAQNGALVIAVAEPSQVFTAGDYRDAALKVLGSIRERCKRAGVVRLDPVQDRGAVDFLKPEIGIV